MPRRRGGVYQDQDNNAISQLETLCVGNEYVGAIVNSEKPLSYEDSI